MEALIAVGLAGNVVQFVQGAGALITLAGEIRKNGSPSSLPDLQHLAETLTGQAAILKSRLKACGATLAQEDQNISDLTAECEQAGVRFMAHLDTMRADDSSGILKTPKTAKTAVRFQMTLNKTNDFVTKLTRLRSSLTLATMLALRTSNESSHQEILVHLKEIQHDNEARDLGNLTSGIEAAVRMLTDTIQDETGERLNSIQNEMQLCLGGITALRQELDLTEGKQGRERQILNWLNFRQVSWRYEGVEKAYHETYEWIFEVPPEKNAWDAFPSHLEDNVEKPYFISGKAGSGKSTLMKFIHNHPRTRAALRLWAGSHELMILHFFFWNLGTSLQKTHVGMLRAMVHTILEQHPELMPASIPGLYRNWRKSDAGMEPEYVEMKRAFELLMEKARYLRFALFIDGVDEFDGDHRDMVLFLRSLASTRVKLIISSRPLTACLQPLAECPTLRLQALTRQDMTKFVHGELSTHHLMTRLIRQFPCKAPQLASDIVEKAEGVFLWVKLVVRLLIEGLENGDNLDELETRLTALPSDLKALYERMFGKMSIEYQKQASLLFQLKEKWLSLVTDRPLPALVLWHAINSLLAVFDQPTAPMACETYDWNMDSLVKRIQSRCCGLLELPYVGKALDGLSSIITAGACVSIEKMEILVVTYLHRTVHEFLTVQEVWQDICRLTNGDEHNMPTRLASAALSTLKLANQITGPTHDWYMTLTTQLCREVMDSSPEMAHRFVLEMDRTMTDLLDKSKADRYHHSYFTSQCLRHWSTESHSLRSADSYGLILECLAPGSLNYASIYTYAAGQGLFCQPMVVPVELNDDVRFQIVLHALSSWQMNTSYTLSLECRSTTMTYLLGNVIRPETEGYNTSLWEMALVVCKKLIHDGRYPEAARLLEIFLSKTESPWTLWKQPVRLPSYIVDAPEALLRSLRVYQHWSSLREDANLVDKIERLARVEKVRMTPEQVGHALHRDNHHYRNKKKKNRRSNKVEKSRAR